MADMSAEDLIEAYMSLIKVQFFLTHLPTFEDRLAQMWSERFQTDVERLRDDMKGLMELISTAMTEETRKQTVKRIVDKTQHQ